MRTIRIVTATPVLIAFASTGLTQDRTDKWLGELVDKMLAESELGKMAAGIRQAPLSGIGPIGLLRTTASAPAGS